MKERGTSARVWLSALPVVMAMATGPALSAPVDISNASFESPVIRAAPYATSSIMDWQRAAVPAWWTAEGYSQQQWLETAGVFYNVPGPTQIENVDGEQAAFMFATPGVELYQDLDATFEIGQSYDLTIGFQGGGLGMMLGVPIEISLYYRDPDSNQVTIGATEALNQTDESLPHIRRLTDWQLEIPTVSVSDPWAGENIGVRILSTVGFEDAGGFWRVDNVRLTAIPEPGSIVLLGAALTTWLARRRGRITT